MRKITEIIIHCTATPRGREVKVGDIDRWHRHMGFDSIGYHYVILLDGTVQTGRDIAKQGAHCTGHNRHSIGVAYVGGLETDCKTPADTRTPAQRDAMKMLLIFLRSRFPDAVIRSHRDFAPKTCPCFDATAEYRDL